MPTGSQSRETRSLHPSINTQMQAMMTPVTPLPPMKPEAVKVSFLSHFGRMCMMANANTLPSSFVLRLSPCSFSVTLQIVFLTFGEICVLLVEGEMVSSAVFLPLRYRYRRKWKGGTGHKCVERTNKECGSHRGKMRQLRSTDAQIKTMAKTDVREFQQELGGNT